MITQVAVEYRKLSRSLALLLAALAPSLPAIMVLLAISSSNRPMPWQTVYFQFALPIWVMFLMPMAVAAFATLLGQIEYRANCWESMFALPVRKSTIFMAKMFVGVSGAIGMMLLMLVLTAIGATLGISVSNNIPPDAIPWAKLFDKAPMILAASAPFIVLQMWVAMRFSNFVVPLAFGITGTMVALAVAITNTSKADWFPWVLPLRALRDTDLSSMPVLALAAAAGLAIAALWDLSRATLR